MAAVSNTSKQPFLAVAINLDEVMTEVVDILQMAKDEVGIITRAVNERMNKSAEDVVLKYNTRNINYLDSERRSAHCWKCEGYSFCFYSPFLCWLFR